jgi:hypothetical protein
LFEIIGHADLPKKFKIYPAQDCTPLFERFLDRAAKTNVAVELNTAGLRKDCREIYPSRAFAGIGGAPEHSHHLRIRRPRAGRSGKRFRGGGRFGAIRRLHAMAPVHGAKVCRNATLKFCQLPL